MCIGELKQFTYSGLFFYSMKKMEKLHTIIKEEIPLVKSKENPELNTFTILNPNFELPKEGHPALENTEKPLSEGNISNNTGSEE